MSYAMQGPTERLTRAAVLAAMERVRDTPRRVCGVTEPHIFGPGDVSAAAAAAPLAGPGESFWAVCANCLTPVDLLALHRPSKES